MKIVPLVGAICSLTSGNPKIKTEGNKIRIMPHQTTVMAPFTKQKQMPKQTPNSSTEKLPNNNKGQGNSLAFLNACLRNCKTNSVLISDNACLASCVHKPVSINVIHCYCHFFSFRKIQRRHSFLELPTEELPPLWYLTTILLISQPCSIAHTFSSCTRYTSTRMIPYLSYTLIGLLASINVTAFAMMAVDKRRSTQNGTIERIPEGILFFLATAGGATGTYLAMHLLRHKTRKWYFQIGIPLLILQHAAILYCVWDTLHTTF